MSTTGWLKPSNVSTRTFVEVQHRPQVIDVVYIRQGGWPSQSLRIPMKDWKEFVAAVKRGEFDFDEGPR